MVVAATVAVAAAAFSGAFGAVTTNNVLVLFKWVLALSLLLPLLRFLLL